MRTSKEIREELLSNVTLGKDSSERLWEIRRNASILRNYKVLDDQDYNEVKQKVKELL